MTPILLTPRDLAVAASLLVADALISLALRLRLHWRLAWAAARMVVQLVLVGYVLRAVFALASPAATLGLVAAMSLVAAREVAARPERRFRGFATEAVGTAAVVFATGLTAVFALTTAIRPTPWYDPRYAVPLAGIILGNVLNAASLTLDSLLAGAARERAAIEARLCLGGSFGEAIAPLLRQSVRRGLLPVVNQMSAAGLVTLPGIMTGQILAGMEPMEAAKYQILLMFLLSGGGGLGAVAAAFLAARHLTDGRARLRLDRLREAR